MEPSSDSVQNKPEAELPPPPREEALQGAPPDGQTAHQSAPPIEQTAQQSAPPDPEPPTPSGATEGASSAPPAPAAPRVKPDSAAQIAASFTDGDDAALDRAVDEAMAGVTEQDLSGTTVQTREPPEPVPGTLLSGRIANIGSDDVLIDFGGKELGTMPLSEFDKDEPYAVGDGIEVLVAGEDRRAGLLRVSRRKARQAAVLRDIKVGAVLEVRVTGMNRGGLEVDIEGLRGFIPASQVDLRFMKDISSLIGQTVRAEVTRFESDNDTPNIVLSRRKALLLEEARQREKVFAELEVGQIRRGRVRSTTDFGAFVDIGGVDGLLHIRDMSWGRVNKAEDVVKVGDEIDVKIIRVSKEKKKVSLGLKQTITHPWQTAAEKYVPGNKLHARVVRLADFGAFVELEPGVDGLLPVSEMSWTHRVRRPSDVVKEGDVVEVGILSVDAEKRRISVSLKALAEDPWVAAAEKYAVGSTVNGKVVRTTDFGAFVQLEDGIDGLVHISEVCDQRIKAVTDKVKAGDEVAVRVLGVDAEAKRVSLSLRKPPPEPTPEEIARIEAERAAAAKKKASRPKRGGLTFGWDEGLGSLDPSKFAR